MIMMDQTKNEGYSTFFSLDAFHVFYCIFQVSIETARCLTFASMYIRNRDIIKPGPILKGIMLIGAMINIGLQVFAGFYIGYYYWINWLDLPIKDSFDSYVFWVFMASILV